MCSKTLTSAENDDKVVEVKKNTVATCDVATNATKKKKVLDTPSNLGSAMVPKNEPKDGTNEESGEMSVT